MAGWARKPSALEQRIRALEKEARRVEEDIRLLSRALKRANGAIPWNRLKTREPPGAGGARAPGERLPGAAEEAEGASAVEERRSGGRAAPEARTASPETERREARQFVFDRRFASYFTSGSFMPGGPPQSEAVERNKLIFVLGLAAVVVFIVLKLLVF